MFQDLLIKKNLMPLKNNIVFGEPCIDKKFYNYLNKTLKKKWIGTGPQSKEFEKKFSDFKKSNYALSVNSCTSAIFLSLKSLNLKKKDEVITTPMTFCSTVNCIIHAGAKPILVDIKRNTLNIDEDKIEEKITKNTKAILIVHFAGLPCNMEKIKKITSKYKIKLIEDCAHAIESKYQGKHVGNFGYSGCYSFYVNKNITTCEGGMITTNNKKLVNFIQGNRLHGLSKDAWKRFFPSKQKKSIYFYDVLSAGFKFNMPDLNASIGLSQLASIENFWLKRKKNYEYYISKLSDLPIKFQEFDSANTKHAYHLLLFYIDKSKTNIKRDQLIKYLNRNKIGFGIHYRSINSMTYYKKTFKWSKKDAPNSYYIGNNTISLPLYPQLTKRQINYICSKVKIFFNKNKKNK